MYGGRIVADLSASRRRPSDAVGLLMAGIEEAAA